MACDFSKSLPIPAASSTIWAIAASDNFAFDSACTTLRRSKSDSTARAASRYAETLASVTCPPLARLLQQLPELEVGLDAGVAGAWRRGLEDLAGGRGRQARPPDGLGQHLALLEVRLDGPRAPRRTPASPRRSAGARRRPSAPVRARSPSRSRAPPAAGCASASPGRAGLLVELDAGRRSWQTRCAVLAISVEHQRRAALGQLTRDATVGVDGHVAQHLGQERRQPLAAFVGAELPAIDDELALDRAVALARLEPLGVGGEEPADAADAAIDDEPAARRDALARRCRRR